MAVEVRPKVLDGADVCIFAHGHALLRHDFVPFSLQWRVFSGSYARSRGSCASDLKSYSGAAPVAVPDIGRAAVSLGDPLDQSEPQAK